MKRILTVVFLFLFASHLSAAELWLRESLVQEHSQTILITIQATPEQIGKRAHPIGEDCDLHFPVKSDDIRVPILGEIKNACSFPEDVTSTTWAKTLKPLEEQTIEVEGALRVWLEHPPHGNEIQCECNPVPVYTNSNPDHMVELHPLTRAGNVSFLDQTTKISQGDTAYLGSTADKLASALGKKKISVRRAIKNGEPYIAIKGPKTGFNHWSFRAEVKSIAEQRQDGHAFTVTVLDGEDVVKDALRALTIKDTRADQVAETLQVNEQVMLFGLVRLDLEVIGQQAGKNWKQITMPYELIVLDVLR